MEKVDLVNRIRALCDERGISFRCLEKAVLLGNGTIGKWKTFTPREENLKLVADYFEVPVEKLMDKPGKEEAWTLKNT